MQDCKKLHECKSCTYGVLSPLETQLPAVRTCLRVRMVPMQTWTLSRRSDTTQGYLPLYTSCPLKMRCTTLSWVVCARISELKHKPKTTRRAFPQLENIFAVSVQDSGAWSLNVGLTSVRLRYCALVLV